ncbi:MAG: aminotransferase class III-fold pyridoxal phosphate-dependent enzyme [Armatimonadota bacterium]|nr:aminotransferase class III-fold pyridoxal phosphate-dependent enzyme [Armatimonadota bacterium]
MPTTEELLNRYEAVTAPAIARDTHLTFVRGEGVYLFDAEGRRYLDFAAGIATMSVGHSHPRVVEAVASQLRTLMHTSIHLGVNEVYVRMLEKLRAIAPAALRSGKGILVNSGAEAVEAGLKLARYATRRPLVVAFQHGFHGRTAGALSLTASRSAYRRHLSALLPGVYHAVYPAPDLPFGRTPEERGQAALTLLEQAFKTVVPPDEVAAIVVEPMLGEGGYLVPPPGFFEGLWALARKHGILMMVDEIQTGMGRTGKWFAIEHWGLEPDILVMGKAIGGGLPLGAMLARREIAEAWEPGAHGSTFGGNPVSCACGLATIDVVESEGLVARAAEIGAFIRQMLVEARDRTPQIGDVRGFGLMLGIEILDPATRAPAPALLKSVLRAGASAGLVLIKCGDASLRLTPPLIITREQAEDGVHTLLGVLDKVGAHAAPMRSA